MIKLFKTFLMLFVMTITSGVNASAVKDPLVNSYLKLSEALASDQKISEFDALEFKTVAKSAKLSAEEKKLVDRFAASTDIKAQREAFKKVSAAVITYAEKKKIKGIYKADCPMAAAEWLQTKEPVRNPYYGSSMLACGSSQQL